MKRCALPAAALALCLVVPAFAQGPGGPGGPGGRGGRPGFGRPGGPGGQGGPLMLLGMPEVQKELQLREEQIAQLQTLRPAGPGGQGGPGGPGRRPGGPEGRGPGQGNPEERQRFQAARQEMEKKLAEILDARQLARLKELEIQRAGTRGVLRPEVADALKLTEAQRGQIQETLRAEGEAMRSAFENAQPEGDRQAMREKMQQLRAETDARVLAVLTDAQKQQFKSLQGAAFTFPEPRFGRPGGGFGGGRPGRPGQN